MSAESRTELASRLAEASDFYEGNHPVTHFRTINSIDDTITPHYSLLFYHQNVALPTLVFRLLPCQITLQNYKFMNPEPRRSRRGQKKMAQHQIQDYLSFQNERIERHDQPPERKIPALTTRQIQQRQQHYLKSKFQFVVLNQPVGELSWEEVLQVHYATTHEITCPICMSDQFEIVVPYITSCGHIYCLPCFMRHRSLSKFNHKCPLCGETVCQVDLKSVKIQKQTPQAVGNIVQLNQVQRSKHLPGLYVDRLESLIYTRILVANRAYAREIAHSEIEQLTNFGDCCEEEIKPSVTQAIQLLASKYEKYENAPGKPEILLEPLPDLEEQLSTFYQDSTGQLGILHPLCNKYLIALPNLPKQLQGELLQIDKLTQTEQTMRRYKFLSHIPLYSDVYFYEIEMKELLPKDDYARFKLEMLEYRQRQKTEMKKQEIKNKILLQRYKQLEDPKEKEAEYAYQFIPENEKFEFREEDFPSLEPKGLEQKQSPTALLTQTKLLQQQQQPNVEQSKKKKDQHLAQMLEDEQHFPNLCGEQFEVKEKIEWGKPSQKEEGEEKGQLKQVQGQDQKKIAQQPGETQEVEKKVEVGDLGFFVVNKQRRKKQKGNDGNH